LRYAGPTWLAAADSPRPEQAKAFYDARRQRFQP
jgi:hypothetical protein